MVIESPNENTSPCGQLLGQEQPRSCGCTCPTCGVQHLTPAWLCRDRGEIIQLHSRLDLLVPTSGPEINHDAVGSFVLPIDPTAPWTLRGIGLFNGGASFLEIINIEANVMHAFDG